MATRLFITGASGYVGRRVVAAAEAAGLPMVTLLREPNALPEVLERAREAGLLEVVPGDLVDPGWQDRIEAGDVVLHLAAATGKATAEEHHRINVEGTRALLEAAASAGAAHFILVSSIAARFPDQTHYPYAHAKGEAERCVREGSLPYTIVRPTIVVGQGAPVLAGFGMLSALPVTPVFGSGERRIQPIDVDDLASALVQLCVSEPTHEILELGGPERLSLNAFLERIRAVRGGGDARLLHLPLVPVRALLALLEPLLLPVLPVTAGQLATFANDGLAEPNDFMAQRSAGLRPLDASLAVPAVERLPAEPFDEGALREECRVLCDHLAGCPPTASIEAEYLRHHRDRPLGPVSAFEFDLLARARRGGIETRLADAYAARLLPRGLLRRKLVLLLALLETDPERFATIDAPDPGNPGAALTRLIGRGLAEVGFAALALLWLGPVHLLAARSDAE